jgi:hypothetical protein
VQNIRDAPRNRYDMMYCTRCRYFIYSEAGDINTRTTGISLPIQADSPLHGTHLVHIPHKPIVHAQSSKSSCPQHEQICGMPLLESNVCLLLAGSHSRLSGENQMSGTCTEMLFNVHMVAVGISLYIVH